MFYLDETKGTNYWRYVEFLNNSNNILTFSSPSNTVEILNPVSGETIKSFPIEQDIAFLTGFSVSKNDKLLALADIDNEFSIWDLENEVPIKTLGGNTFLVKSDGQGEGDFAKVLFTDDSKYLIFGTAYSLNLLDIEQNKIINSISLTEINYSTRSLKLSKSNKRLAVRYGGNKGEELVILDFPSFKEISRYNLGENYIEIDEIEDDELLTSEFYDEDKVLINSLNNSSLDIFNIDDNLLVKSDFKAKSPITIFKLNHDQTKLILVTGNAEIWDIRTKECLSVIPFEVEHGKISISLSSDNKLVAVTSFIQTDNYEYSLLILDVQTGNYINEFLKQKSKKK